MKYKVARSASAKKYILAALLLLAPAAVRAQTIDPVAISGAIKYTTGKGVAGTIVATQTIIGANGQPATTVLFTGQIGSNGVFGVPPVTPEVDLSDLSTINITICSVTTTPCPVANVLLTKSFPCMGIMPIGAQTGIVTYKLVSLVFSIRWNAQTKQEASGSKITPVYQVP